MSWHHESKGSDKNGKAVDSVRSWHCKEGYVTEFP